MNKEHLTQRRKQTESLPKLKAEKLLKAEFTNPTLNKMKFKTKKYILRLLV